MKTETVEERRERLRRLPIPPRPKPKVEAPTLTLAASKDRTLEEESQVASVALEPEDVETVRQALAGRSVRIGSDEVGFDRVTNARVTMRWCRPTPVFNPPRVISEYNPLARERLPGYRGDDV
jgi:hypothetical protein